MCEPFLDVQKKPRQRNHDLAKPWQTTCAVGRKTMGSLIGNRQAAEKGKNIETLFSVVKN